MKLKKLLINLIPFPRIRRTLRRKCCCGKNLVVEALYKNNFIEKTAHLGNPENIELGGKVYIGEDCRFYAEGGLKIGAYTKFGQGCMILTTNHNYKSQTRIPYDHIGLLHRVEIGENCWIGVRSLIASGVIIEEGAIVAMGSVVTKSVPKCAIVGGNPAKIIGWRDKDTYEQLKKMQMNYPQENELSREWIRDENSFKKFITE